MGAPELHDTAGPLRSQGSVPSIPQPLNLRQGFKAWLSVGIGGNAGAEHRKAGRAVGPFSFDSWLLFLQLRPLPLGCASFFPDPPRPMHEDMRPRTKTSPG